MTSDVSRSEYSDWSSADGWEPRTSGKVDVKGEMGVVAALKAEQARKLRTAVERRRASGDKPSVLAHYEKIALQLEREVEELRLRSC